MHLNININNKYATKKKNKLINYHNFKLYPKLQKFNENLLIKN